MPQVIALSCPVCAAPLIDDTSRCAFCGSLVVIKTDFARIDATQLNRAVVGEHIARYRAVVRRDPNDESAHYGLGVAYFNLGLMDEAADELAQAARLRPEHPHVQTQLAVVYAELAKRGRADAAALASDRIERALLLEPGLADALILRARLAARREDWAAAVADLRLAARSDPATANPKLGTALSRQAERLLRTGQWIQGTSLLEEAVALNPGAARPRLAGVIQANVSLLTDPVLDSLDTAVDGRLHPLRPPGIRPQRSPGRAALVAFAKVFGIGVGGVILAAIVASGQPSGSTGSAFVGLIALLALLAMVASPIVGIVAWRRAATRATGPVIPGATAGLRLGGRERRERRQALKAALVAGATTNDGQLVAGARHVARVRQQLDAERAMRQR